MDAKFSLGRVVATRAALKAVRNSRVRIQQFLARHTQGDWGDALCTESRLLNDEAVFTGERIHSSYYLAHGQKLWIFTEADRSATTIILPSEY